MKASLSADFARVSLLVFAASAALRSIPELLAGGYPVGFDVGAYYPYFIENMSHFSAIDSLRVFPLFYWLLGLLRLVTRSDLYVILKVVATLMFGTFIVAFLNFERFFLHFAVRKSLGGAALLALQPVTLRISWDMLRLELGLSLMLFALSMFRMKSEWKYLLISILGILTVLSHPYPTVLLIVGALGMLFFRGFEISKTPLIAALAPSIIMLLMIAIFSARAPYVSTSQVTFIPVSPGGMPSPLVVNVFLDDANLVSRNYSDLLSQVLLLFLYSYGPLLPFVARGRLHEPVITLMSAWLVLASFSVLILPTESIPTYWRWELLMVLVMPIFAIHGIENLGGFRPRNRRLFALLILAFLVVALGYSTGSYSYMGNYGVSDFAPGSMVQSSIAIGQVNEAISNLRWLNSQAPPNSLLLMDERFISLATATLGNNVRLIVQPGGPPFRGAVPVMMKSNPSEMYLIWENGLQMNGFEEVHTTGAFSIYEYTAIRTWVET